MNTVAITIGLGVIFFGLVGYARSFWRGSHLRGENRSGGDYASPGDGGWSSHYDGGHGGDGGGHG